MGKIFMELRKIITVIVYTVSISIVLYVLVKVIQATHALYWMY